MKVVLVNSFERTGGAAIAAGRLHKALQSRGIEVNRIVLKGKEGTADVTVLNNTLWRRLINRIRFVWERGLIFLGNRCSRKNLFVLSLANTGSDISEMALIRQADVIHIHWINQGMLSLRDIEKLGRLGKPIVWTMHDMWPCTAICHYARDCKQYYAMCEACPLIATSSMAVAVMKKKQAVWKTLPVTFVTCSEWLREKAARSVLLQGKRLLSIANPIDSTCYRPKARLQCRKRFGLPAEKRLILFGAFNVLDERKGFVYLVESMKLLLDRYPIWKECLELVVVGNSKSDVNAAGFALPIHQIAYVNGDEAMADLYNAVDLYVLSSLEDNLPNMIMEAMACGVPCVGFRVGGIPEMIDSSNGYVATYKSAEDLSYGINSVLASSDDYLKLSENARKKVLERYSFGCVADKYIQLYKQLIHEQ